MSCTFEGASWGLANYAYYAMLAMLVVAHDNWVKL